MHAGPPRPSAVDGRSRGVPPPLARAVAGRYGALPIVNGETVQLVVDGAVAPQAHSRQVRRRELSTARADRPQMVHLEWAVRSVAAGTAPPVASQRRAALRARPHSSVL